MSKFHELITYCSLAKWGQVTSKVRVDYEYKTLRSIKKINNDEEIELLYTIMQVEIVATTEQVILDADDPK